MSTKTPHPLWQHVRRYRSGYFHAPIAVALVFAVAAFYRHLTGYASPDQLGTVNGILGMAVNFLTVALAAFLTVLLKPMLFTDLNDEEFKTFPWWRVVIDTCISAALFSFCFWALSH